MSIRYLVCAALLASAATTADEFSQGQSWRSADDLAVLPLRQRPAVENQLVDDRIKHVLPALMAEANLDMWLVINREYAEDPVYFTLVPQPSFAARRTTMLMFVRKPDGSVTPYSVNRYPLGAPYQSAWSGGDLTAQWQALSAEIQRHQPKRIGINVSTHWPIADGLSHGLYQQLQQVLPADYQQRLVPAESLVVRWMEQRTEAELQLYPHIVGIARSVIAEAFSSKVITPGVTTTDDVSWFIRQRFEALGLPIWFMPDVNLQRAEQSCGKDSPFCGSEGVIQRGDVLHTDVGICYLKLCTDTQEMGYVLRLGEQQVPAGLQSALATGNQWQDMLTSNFKTGRTGNQVLAATAAQSKKQGVQSSTYSHALGFVGHAPGPTIGMWDNQQGTPIHGDWPIHANTVYAIEGNVKYQLAEWKGNYIQIKLEQSAVFNGEKVVYLAGRQTQWHLVR